jgi:hypothetical protein
MAYGYVGVGECRRCNKPEHLFVSSMSDYGADAISMCTDCQSFYSNEGTTPTPVPIMSETPRCQACARPEYIDPERVTAQQRWNFIPAYLADGERTIIVHSFCSANHCHDCDKTYAITRYRNYRNDLTIPVSEFTEFEQVEGDDRCTNCANKIYDEGGGRDYWRNCDACDDIQHTDNMLSWNDGRYCEYCYDNNVYTCDDCSEQYWDGDGHDCETDEGVIHSYSYRPSPYFFGKGQYHLGFELEVEARNESRYAGAEIAQDTLGSHAYMKDDGSLSDGFEIVTHPHTLQAYQTDFDWEFTSKLKREGFRSWNTDTCGLHVHVSRTAFGTGESPWGRSDRDQLILKRQSHELRFMKLIYDNQRQVERIAGRAGNHYATFQDKGKLVPKVKYGNQTSGRYSAINTENDATLEVRVFKGSLRKERVLSALEFVTASVEYTRDLKVTSKNQALSWLRFTAYVSENMETYPNLALIMSESFASDNNPNEN